MPLPDLSPETRHLIDGRLVESVSGARFPNINPATGDVLGTTADGTVTDLQAAIAAARRAFDATGWATDAALRARCLRQLHAGLVAEKEQLRSIVVREAGAPIALTPFMQVDDPIDMLEYWARKAETAVYEQPMADVSFLGRPQRRILRREAMGVVGAITPWNAPLLLNITKIGAALAAGCAVVLKPAPDTPWSATHLGRIATAATDLPPGVLNIVASSDPLVGEALVRDPRVDMVTFTGSTATGRRVMECGATTVKKVFLELGGKSAAIVLDDADLKTAIGAISSVWAFHSGQICTAPTRVLAQRGIYDQLVEGLKAAAGHMKVGDPLERDTVLGPVITGAHRSRIGSYIQAGRDEGGTIVTGGELTDVDGKGFFVQPTLIADCKSGMKVVQEEIFGPVISVVPFDDEAEVVALANSTEFGLYDYVFSKDGAKAYGIAQQLRTGNVGINSVQRNHELPFGGFKMSGVGRDGGRFGFHAYSELQSIVW